MLEGGITYFVMGVVTTIIHPILAIFVLAILVLYEMHKS